MSLGDTLIVLAVYLLATARLTRLINYDTLTDPIRGRVADQAAAAAAAAAEADTAGQTLAAARQRRRQDRWATGYAFLGCPWCVGWWIALAAAPIPVAVIGWPWWSVPLLALAASHLIGVADPLAADDDIEIVAR